MRPASRKRKSLAERRRAWRALLVAGVATLVIALAGVSVYALHLPTVTITSVTVTDGAYVRADEVKDIAYSFLQGSYALVVPRASTFFYPRSAIVRAIEHAFPAATDVSVTRTSLTALAIRVTERAPAARWCGDECYFVDESGVIFAPAESVSGIQYRGSVNGTPVGQTYLDGGFPTLADFVGKLGSGIGRTIERVTVSADDDVSVVFADGGEVRFDRADIGDALLNTIVTTFHSKGFMTDRPLDYADFRFGQKVYVKWR